MSKKNELLAADIEKRIDKARNTLPEKEKSKGSIFNTVVIILVTFAVLISLFRFLF